MNKLNFAALFLAIIFSPVVSSQQAMQKVSPSDLPDVGLLQKGSSSKPAELKNFNINIAPILEFTLLDQVKTKAPYKHEVLIQNHDCEENCNTISLFLDHTTSLINEKGKTVNIYKLKADKAYRISRFTVQSQISTRLEEVIFIEK